MIQSVQERGTVHVLLKPNYSCCLVMQQKQKKMNQAAYLHAKEVYHHRFSKTYDLNIVLRAHPIILFTVHPDSMMRVQLNKKSLNVQS